MNNTKPRIYQPHSTGPQYVLLSDWEDLEQDRDHWKNAITNELVLAGIFQEKHENDPVLAINDAINWNVEVALDPAVSEEAAKLRDTYKSIKE